MIVAQRWFFAVSLVLVPGCTKDEGETSEPASAGTTAAMSSSGGSAGGSSGDTPTGGVLTTTVDPTTSEPVACDGPESCTAMDEGDLSGVTVPFFRGSFCVSDAVKPGDKLAVSVSACVHPCLDVNAFAFKWANRCAGEGCEVALALYYTGVAGEACPSDVFGEFDPGACVFTGPHAPGITPPAKEGPGALLLPFLTNTDAAAIAGGEAGAAIWTRVDSHAQAAARRIAIDYSVTNAAAPVACADGMSGCTCSSVGL